jgi:hypothetical protein
MRPVIVTWPDGDDPEVAGTEVPELVERFVVERGFAYPANICGPRNRSSLPRPGGTLAVETHDADLDARRRCLRCPRAFVGVVNPPLAQELGESPTPDDADAAELSLDLRVKISGLRRAAVHACCSRGTAVPARVRYTRYATKNGSAAQDRRAALAMTNGLATDRTLEEKDPYPTAGRRRSC